MQPDHEERRERVMMKWQSTNSRTPSNGISAEENTDAIWKDYKREEEFELNHKEGAELDPVK